MLTAAYCANALAVLPGGRGPPMDLGRRWPADGRRVFGPSKSWSGFLLGTIAGSAIGLLQADLILAAPPNLAIVPRLAPTVIAAVPVVVLLAGGALAGDALGSFVKRRLGRPSGERVLLLDQLPFVAVPVLLGALLFPGLFVPTFGSWVAVAWLLVFTLGLHVLFNRIGYWAGWKEVPW